MCGRKEKAMMSEEGNRPQFLSQCSLGKDSSAPVDPAAAPQHSGSIPNEQAFIEKNRALNETCSIS